MNEDWQKMRPHVGAIADILSTRYPQDYRVRMIPYAACGAIAEQLTMVIAEVIQAWIDAGSERDVTLEELTPIIERHLVGWSDNEEEANKSVGL
jgi:hypothetical protein